MPALPQTAYHIVDAANWPAVQREGLLCTRDLATRAGAAAAPLLAFRPRSVAAPGVGFVRDQAPMPPAALARCLDPGLTPQAWYDLVNAHVFFWADADRLARHLRALAPRPQVVLVLDAPRLAERYAGSAFVTPFNIGAARRKPAPRGLRTLVPVERYAADGWRDEAPPGGPVRPRSHRPAELVIRGSAPDALSYLLEVRT